MLREGMYHHQLKRFYDRFEAKDIKIILYEDFIQKTDEVVKDVFAFLGVDPSVKVGTDVVYNKSGTVKNKALDSVVGQNAGPIVFLKKFLPGMHRFLKDNVTVNRWLFSLRNKNLVKSEYPAELRQKVIDEIFAEDIKKTSDLIGRDLSHWL